MGLLRQTAGIWGPAAFGAAAAIAAGRQPGYSHRTHHVSGLAAKGQRSATVMVPGFVALSASNLVAPRPDATLARLGRAAGVTALLAGLIQASTPACPRPGTDPEATAADVGHTLVSIATFGLWTAMPFVAARRPGPRWFRVTSRVAGVASLATLAAAGATTQTGSPSKGLAQRAFLGTVFTWQAAAAIDGLTREATS